MFKIEVGDSRVPCAGCHRDLEFKVVKREIRKTAIVIDWQPNRTDRFDVQYAVRFGLARVKWSGSGEFDRLG